VDREPEALTAIGGGECPKMPSPSIDQMVKLRAVFAAAFILGATPALAILVDAPAATAQMPAGKHGDSGSPDGCVPMGVTKHPDGTVWAVEKCHGQLYYERMTD
jgi:hypothetical protein